LAWIGLADSWGSTGQPEAYQASRAVASGADVQHPKVRIGHESISTTSRFYLQMYEGRDAEIAKRLEQLAGDPVSPRRLRGPP
jgi:hypothetical protein